MTEKNLENYNYMKHTTPILLILLTSSLNAQTFITMSGGTSTKKDAALHANIGYQYKIVSIEAGIIGAPLNTDRPLFITGFTTIDLPINDNFKMVPLAGISARTWQPGKNKETKTGAYLGARVQFKDGFIQVANSDETYFFSIGLKGFIRE